MSHSPRESGIWPASHAKEPTDRCSRLAATHFQSLRVALGMSTVFSHRGVASRVARSLSCSRPTLTCPRLLSNSPTRCQSRCRRSWESRLSCTTAICSLASQSSLWTRRGLMRGWPTGASSCSIGSSQAPSTCETKSWRPSPSIASPSSCFLRCRVATFWSAMTGHSSLSTSTVGTVGLLNWWWPERLTHVTPGFAHLTHRFGSAATCYRMALTYGRASVPSSSGSISLETTFKSDWGAIGLLIGVRPIRGWKKRGLRLSSLSV